MSYVIFDLEWNQARYCGAKVRRVLNRFAFRLIGEIIQVGAVKLDDRGNIIDDFKVGIRPQFFSVINKNVKELTGIDQEMLEAGLDFPTAIHRFKEWCGNETSFFSWGRDDSVVLAQNLALYEMNAEFFQNFFDLQKIFSMQVENVVHKQVALIRAVEHFDIHQDGAAHDALNDAYYAAYVAQKLDLPKGMEATKQIEKKDIFDGITCVKKEIFPSIHVKLEAFSKLKITNSYCVCCKNKMRNRKVVKVRKNEYMLLSTCKQDGIFFIRIKFIKDYCGTMVAHKEMYPVNQELMDFYHKKLSEKTAKKLLRRDYVKHAQKIQIAEAF